MNIECKYCRHGICSMCAYYSSDNWNDNEDDDDYDEDDDVWYDIYSDLDGLDIDDIM